MQFPRALYGLRGGRSCPWWQEAVHVYVDGSMRVFNIRVSFGCVVEEPSETRGSNLAT